MPAATHPRRALRTRFERCTQLVPLAAARQVLEEASLYLGVPLPMRYAAGLAFRAERAFVHSSSFRRGFRGRADGGRERLYVYFRHWLAARLKAERPALFARLPASYCVGEPLPAPLAPRTDFRTPSAETPLSPAARLLADW